MYVTATPGGSSWSNKITERHNAILGNISNKLLILLINC